MHNSTTENIIYFLKQKEKGHVKIGFTTNIKQRVSKLEKDWGQFDPDSELYYLDEEILKSDKLTIGGIEKTIHRILTIKGFEKINEKENKDGETEFFVLDEYVLKEVVTIIDKSIDYKKSLSSIYKNTVSKNIKPNLLSIQKKVEDEIKLIRELATEDNCTYQKEMESKDKYSLDKFGLSFSEIKSQNKFNLESKILDYKEINVISVNMFKSYHLKEYIFHIGLIGKDMLVNDFIKEIIFDGFRIHIKDKKTGHLGLNLAGYVDSLLDDKIEDGWNLYFRINYDREKANFGNKIHFIIRDKVKEFLSYFKYSVKLNNSQIRKDLIFDYEEKIYKKSIYSNNNLFLFEYLKKKKKEKKEIHFNEILSINLLPDGWIINFIDGSKFNLYHNKEFIKDRFGGFTEDSGMFGGMQVETKKQANYFNNRNRSIIKNNDFFIHIAKIKNKHIYYCKDKNDTLYGHIDLFQ